MRGRHVSQYEQCEISLETIEQELRPVVCEQRQTYIVIITDNYSIDSNRRMIFFKLLLTVVVNNIICYITH